MEPNPKLGELRQGRNNKNTRLEESKHMDLCCLYGAGRNDFDAGKSISKAPSFQWPE
jgi:hypothetical protein